MDNKKMKSILAVGEHVAVEFKKCSNGIESDTYESVCAFLNRFGGDIFLGVENDGSVRGISPQYASDLTSNFISMMNNPDVISPTFRLDPQILIYDDKTIIHIHVPQSSEVHTYKKVIYDRVGDSDVKVTATGQIAQMYIRKQKMHTERNVFPYVKQEDLRLDLLTRFRQMAINKHPGHPWGDMTDMEIINSAGLISDDAETGKRGFNLAGVLLLGNDRVILSCCPPYRTDALLRKVNVDRYDDRDFITTNLVESYDRLMQFASKHLLDKFYLEGDKSISIMSIISREILVNTLMHREYSSSMYVRFIIERDRMYTENANRARSDGNVTENYSPESKNPIIAAFFRNIGLADELGSGTRRLKKYVPFYSGAQPEMHEGDVFRTIIPLDDNYSYSVGKNNNIGNEVGDTIGNNLNATQKKIVDKMRYNPKISAKIISKDIGISLRNVEVNISKLKQSKILTRVGSAKGGYWVINN